jgi:hypothetical protein
MEYMRNIWKSFISKSEWKINLKDIVVDGRIILKYILKECSGRM